jgi:ABC-type uncharacterized transport system, permease component
MQISSFELPSRLQQLLTAPTSDPWMLAGALGLAFFLGAAHALTPGHGKTIVAAYLAGSRGRVLDAVWLGGIVTFTHTASVFVLGLITLYASQHVAVDRIYPWLALLSGTLVTLIGGSLLLKRIRGEADHHHGPGGHHHHHHHHHHHDHHHSHDHADHHHDHTHGHHHSGGRESRAGLLSLGISGGLVPCPEALVVLMLSLTLRQLGFGLALLTAFSLGLAAVLIAIGVLMVLAAPLLGRLSEGNRFSRLLPVGSAAVVTVLGIGLMAEALRQL